MKRFILIGLLLVACGSFTVTEAHPVVKNSESYSFVQNDRTTPFEIMTINQTHVDLAFECVTVVAIPEPSLQTIGLVYHQPVMVSMSGQPAGHRCNSPPFRRC